MITIDNYLDNHYIHRSNWLRAAVLGANDGIISISSLAIGVAAASSTREPIVLATVAGLVAGALSMAAGEYVSVSSQTDIEKGDIEREKLELIEFPEQEFEILAQIYERRGLKKETALIVAKELTEADALGAHIRDELGITDISQANPISGLSIGCSLHCGRIFTIGSSFTCSSKIDGIHAICIYHCFLNCAGHYFSKNGRLEYKKCGNTHCNLGDISDGTNCSCW